MKIHSCFGGSLLEHNVMKQRWEIVHWPNNKRVQLCDSKEIAERLLPYQGKSHIVREVWFYDDGTLYKEKK